MRRENLCLLIAGLVTISAGWTLNAAKLACIFDPFGFASAVIPENIGLGLAAQFLQVGIDACVLLALGFIATGLAIVADDNQPVVRRVIIRS